VVLAGFEHSFFFGTSQQKAAYVKAAGVAYDAVHAQQQAALD
jgi:hypothetical protein